MSADHSELIKQPLKATCPSCGTEIEVIADVAGGNARLIQAADALLAAARRVLEGAPDAEARLRVAVAFAEGG